jgi:hypothetical protein
MKATGRLLTDPRLSLGSSNTIDLSLLTFPHRKNLLQWGSLKGEAFNAP